MIFAGLTTSEHDRWKIAGALSAAVRAVAWSAKTEVSGNDCGAHKGPLSPLQMSGTTFTQRLENSQPLAVLVTANWFASAVASAILLHRFSGRACHRLQPQNGDVVSRLPHAQGKHSQHPDLVPLVFRIPLCVSKALYYAISRAF